MQLMHCELIDGRAHASKHDFLLIAHDETTNLQWRVQTMSVCVWGEWITNMARDVL
jgi:hypothetical protein